LGNIKNQFIKNLAKTLIEKYPDRFTNSFEKNKEEMDKIVILESKKIRNKVAGCLVHEIRKREVPKQKLKKGKGEEDIEENVDKIKNQNYKG